MPVNLLFDRPLIFGQPVSLVFGADPGAGLVTDLTVAVALPALEFRTYVGPPVDLTLDAALPALEFACEARYISGTDRPFVNHVANDWQVAIETDTGVDTAHRSALQALAGAEHAQRQALFAESGPSFTHDRGVSTPAAKQERHQDALRVGPLQHVARHQNMLRGYRPNVVGRFQNGDPVRTSRSSRWQDMLRRPRPSVSSTYQPAIRVRIARREAVQVGVDLRRGWASQFQEAIQPQPGAYVPPVIPPDPEDPCYLPNPHLLFSTPWSSSAALLFYCENHGGPVDPPPGATIVVPIRRVYFVLNNVSLKRVSGSLQLPTLSLRMSLDAESWSWGFQATLPAAEYANVAPAGDGTPVELEAMINGAPYRLLAEKISRSRSFNKATINVSGRGRNAILDAPYAPLQSFGNDEFRTSQQLMDDVLTLNEIPLGWTVEYGPAPWDVPAGAFSHQGSYMTAVLAIAGAAGAYVQPHDTAATLRVLSRYPVAPWDWGTVTPDFELPAAVTTQESIEWTEKPRYNRVFVSGTREGVLGQVTRTGTAGDVVAPLITDPLITDAIVARQRGISVLADTGRTARLSLRLPVLALTGVIKPGAFVRYNETPSISRVGLVRATDIAFDRPEVWQTLEVETHG